MNVSVGESVGPALKSALVDVTDRFSYESATLSLADHKAGDEFGTLAVCADQLFMELADDYIAEHAQELSPETQRQLERKFDVAQLGLGTSALLLELAPLVCLREVPGIDLTANEAAQIAGNSYDFIEQIIKHGSIIGTTLVRDLIRPEGNAIFGWQFNGAVVNGELVNPIRLGQFDLGLTEDRMGAKIVPKDVEWAIKVWEEQVTDKTENAVTCPAYLLKHPATGLPFTWHLFDALKEHARQSVYPHFIPSARRALQAAEV